MNNRDKTRRLAVCAMLSALGVVLLYFGALIELVDISMAVIASLLCVFAVIEYSGGYPWMIYAATGILSILLLPNKTPAAMYSAFFGFYPMLKEKLERRPRVICWVLKEIIFNISLAVMIVLVAFVFTVGELAISPLYIAAFVLLCEVAFVLYDIALTRLISFYVFRLRSRFRFK